MATVGRLMGFLNERSLVPENTPKSQKQSLTCQAPAKLQMNCRGPTGMMGGVRSHHRVQGSGSSWPGRWPRLPDRTGASSVSQWVQQGWSERPSPGRSSRRRWPEGRPEVRRGRVGAGGHPRAHWASTPSPDPKTVLVKSFPATLGRFRTFSAIRRPFQAG